MIRLLCVFAGVLLVAEAVLADPVACGTDRPPGSTATGVYHISMGEFPQFAVASNLLEPVYQCRLPFTYDDGEGFVLYVNETTGGGNSGDSDPGASDFSDILVGIGGLLTLYSDPSEVIDNYRTYFPNDPPTKLNTVNEIGNELDNYFVFTQLVGQNHDVPLAEFYVISDQSPEPLTLVLLASGLGFVFSVRRRMTTGAWSPGMKLPSKARRLFGR